LPFLDGSAVPAGLQPLIQFLGESPGFPITLFRFAEQGSGPGEIRGNPRSNDTNGHCAV